MIEPAVAAAVAGVVGEANVDREPRARRAASADCSWLSPILRRELDGMLADLVVRPAAVDELARVVEIAHRAGVPLTMRGRGTGNYGQAVPLAGGVVVDTTRLARVLDVASGWITAEAGATFVALEAAARCAGQELAMFPSTTRSTLAGFLAGGAGGTGSIENGFVWDGFVGSLEAMPCLPDVAAVTVTGDAEVAPFLHSYGTTGVLAAATVRLVPARRWMALLASFARWEDALAVAGALLDREPLPRNLAVDEPATLALYPPDAAMPAGRVSLRAIVADADVADVARLIASGGGRSEAVRPDGAAQLVGLSFNHVTLRAVRARPSLCHLQVGGPALAERADEVRACLPGAMIHVTCGREGGRPWFGGLLLSEFRDRETLGRGIADLEELGVRVIDPHTCRLGGHGDVEALRRHAAAWDPEGLLNPGKLPAAAAGAGTGGLRS